MPRLLTVVGEVVANKKPQEPYEWFNSYGNRSDLEQSEDRCRLFLGIDAERAHENSAENMLDWIEKFEHKFENLNRNLIVATVYFLDWPSEDGRLPVLNLEAVDSLTEAGLCYRPKDERFYGPNYSSLTASLTADLKEKKLIADDAEQSLPIEAHARPKPDEDDPNFKGVVEYLGSNYLSWPDEEIKRLLER